MTELVDFLTVQLAMTEQRANTLLEYVVPVLRAQAEADREGGIPQGVYSSSQRAEDVEIAASELLRGVEAKRRTIEQHVGYYGSGDDEFWPVQALRLLALPYADQPDYREEWAL